MLLHCRLLQESQHTVTYRIHAAYGDIHFWGIASEWNPGSDRASDTHDFDDARSLKAEGIEGTIAFSRSNGRVLTAGFQIPVSVKQVTPYYLEYFGDRGAPFSRLHVQLPNKWRFDEAYDSCPVPSVVFRPQLVTHEMAVSHSQGFEYDAGYPADPHWRLAALGAWFETTFTLDRPPTSGQLRIRHLSSASADAPGGGFSPVNIMINGRLFQACYDPAENHGGTHGFVVDVWDVGSFLRTGPNSIRIQLCGSAWTSYWISHLVMYAFAGECRECSASDLVHVDLLETENEKAHHTSDFADETTEVRGPVIKQVIAERLILRRNQTFDVLLKGPPDAIKDLRVNRFEAKDLFATEESILIDVVTGPLKPAWWEAQAIGGITATAEGEAVRRFRINIPFNAPLGAYAFSVRYEIGTSPSHSESQFPLPVVILFNPWPNPQSLVDAVTLQGDRELREYVLDEYGHIWKTYLGIFWGSVGWRFDQFSSPYSLNVLLRLCAPLPSSERRDPALVARYLTGCLHTQRNRRYASPPGVVVGNWGDPKEFNDDNSPNRWSSSSEILSKYFDTDAPVEYGQCWVFAGIITSVLRAAGIPTRTVTAQETARLRDSQPHTADLFYYRGRLFEPGKSGWDGAPIVTEDKIFEFPSLQLDGKWAFHVWCEGWMERQGDFGWQVLDPTPQVRSAHPPHYYEVGPAAQLDIRENADLEYDVSFVRNEVTAPIVRWDVQGKNPDGTWNAKMARSSFWSPNPDNSTVGNLIVTTTPSNDRADITMDYKGSSRLSSHGAEEEPDWHAELQAPETIRFGDSIPLRVGFENQAPSARKLHATLTLAVIASNGQTLFNLPSERDEDVDIPPSGNAELSLNVAPAEYIPLCSHSDLIELRLCVRDLATGDLYVDERYLLLAHSPVTLVAPSAPIHLGEEFPISITWTNETGMTLPSVELKAITGLTSSLGDDGTSSVVASDFPPGAIIQLTTNLTGLRPGRLLLAGRVLGSWVSGIETTHLISISSSLELTVALTPSGAGRLSFHGLPGREYLIESSQTLDNPMWTAATSRVMGSDTAVFVDIESSAKEAFYRVTALKPDLVVINETLTLRTSE